MGDITKLKDYGGGQPVGFGYSDHLASFPKDSGVVGSRFEYLIVEVFWMPGGAVDE